MIGVDIVNISHPNTIDGVIQSTSLETSEWYKDILFYLRSSEFPLGMSSKERRDLKMKNNQYVLVSWIIFRRKFDGILLICLDHPKSKETLQEFHNGVCGGNFFPIVIAHRIIRVGYYWPIMFKYAYTMILKCHSWRKISRKMKRDGMPLI